MSLPVCGRPIAKTRPPPGACRRLVLNTAAFSVVASGWTWSSTNLDLVHFYPLDLVQQIGLPGISTPQSLDLVQHFFSDLVQHFFSDLVQKPPGPGPPTPPITRIRRFLRNDWLGQATRPAFWPIFAYCLARSSHPTSILAGFCLLSGPVKPPDQHFPRFLRNAWLGGAIRGIE